MKKELISITRYGTEKQSYLLYKDTDGSYKHQMIDNTKLKELFLKMSYSWTTVKYNTHTITQDFKTKLQSDIEKDMDIKINEAIK